LHFLPLFYTEIRSDDIWDFAFGQLEEDLYEGQEDKIKVALSFYILSIASKIIRDEDGQKRINYLKDNGEKPKDLVKQLVNKALHFNLFEVYQYIIPLFDGFYEKYSPVVQ